MEQVKQSGKARNIGVSNFQRPHLESILEIATIKPALNQLEYHPYLQRANDYVPWMKAHGIKVSAFKGLAPVTVGKGGPLDEILQSIANKHGVDSAAVLLKWHVAQNVIPITTTGSKERLTRYLEAVDLKLTAEEVEEISQTGSKHHFRWWGSQFFDKADRS